MFQWWWWWTTPVLSTQTKATRMKTIRWCCLRSWCSFYSISSNKWKTKNRCILWHAIEMDRIWKKVSSFLSFRLHALFSEIPIFARFSAILRHGQRNAKNLFTYLTKVKVSTRQQIWPNGNVNDVTAIMPRSNTITLTFHLAAYAGLWHDDTPITSYYIQQPYELFGTEYQPYPLFTAFSFFYHHLNASKMF